MSKLYTAKYKLRGTNNWVNVLAAPWPWGRENAPRVGYFITEGLAMQATLREAQGGDVKVRCVEVLK